MIKNDISFIACHTNFDLVKGGVSFLLANKLGLSNLRPLVPLNDLKDVEVTNMDITIDESKNFGLGVIGTLKKEMSLKEFAVNVKEALNTHSLRIASTSSKRIKKVAVCGGSGYSFWFKALNAGDVFVTADVKYHEFFDAENDLVIVDIGHFESEQYSKDIFYDIISKNFSNFAIHFSEINTNPINYL